MHNNGPRRSKRSKVSYYATILMVSAVGFIVYGLVLYLTSGNSFLSDIGKNNNKPEVVDNGSSVTISTNDGSVVVPNGSLGGNNSSIFKDDPVPTSNPGSLGGQNNPTPPSNNNGGGNNGGGSHQVQPQQPSQPQQPAQPYYPTIEETNNTFRNTIQSTYGVTVKYGAETNGYTVGGIGTVPITDSTVINSALNNLNNALSKYPKGLFSEIRNGGIPLTVILIQNYSNPSVTGITDSNYSFAHISIAVAHPFDDSFFHESYHYIERYIFKRGGNFSAWDSLNPQGFVYNQNISNANSYANSFNEHAPFVNTYAQTAATEDRASTFEYMMAANKASCLNQNTTVWKKANMISGMIDAVLTSVSPSTVEYWERHL